LISTKAVRTVWKNGPKMLEKRINTAIEMLKNGDVDELSKKSTK